MTVNLGGAPRLHNRDQIALDLIEWAKKEDSINLNKFCCYYVPPFAPSKITLWSNEDDKFREAVELAKSYLGFRREEWLNEEKLHIKGYDLNAETYDYFLKEEKRLKSKFESNLRKEEDSKKPQAVNLYVRSDGLGSGLNIPAQTLPNQSN